MLPVTHPMISKLIYNIKIFILLFLTCLLNRFFSNEDLLNQVPKAFIFMSIISALLSLIGLSMMFDKEDSQDMDHLINEKQDEDLDEIEQPNGKEIKFCNRQKKHSLKFLEAIKIPEIYMICIMTGFYFVGPTNFDIYFKVKKIVCLKIRVHIQVKLYFFLKSFGQTFVNDDKFLTTINAGSSIINLFIKLLWGWIIDKYCFKVLHFKKLSKLNSLF